MKLKTIHSKRKGQLGNLQGIVLSLVIVGILLGAGFFILAEFLDQAATINSDGSNNASENAINLTIAALTKVPELLGLIVLIAVIGIILALIFTVIPGARVSGV